MALERKDDHANVIPKLLKASENDPKALKFFIERLSPADFAYLYDNFHEVIQIAKECKSHVVEMILEKMPEPLTADEFFSISIQMKDSMDLRIIKNNALMLSHQEKAFVLMKPFVALLHVINS